MENRFQELKNKVDQLTVQELQDEVLVLASEIVNTDSRLLSVDKKWRGYGTWKSSGFANEYHFGQDLSKILVKALSSKVIHDEDYVFELSEFEEDIFNEIFESI